MKAGAVLNAVVLVLLFKSVGLAEAPVSVGGMIYHETSSVGITTNPSTSWVAYDLRKDGSYLQLFGIGWRVRDTPSQYGFGEPSAGQYTYQKLGPMEARLVLTATDGSGRVRTVTLSFTSDYAGGTSTTLFPMFFRFSNPSAPNPLVNFSTRIFIPAGKSAIVGLTAAWSAPLQSVLIRAVGPGLVAFGVPEFLKNPKLTVKVLGGREEQRNDDWEVGNSVLSMQRVHAMVGAFPLVSGSKDAAVVVPEFNRLQTVVVEANDPLDSGEVLLEVYLIP